MRAGLILLLLAYVLSQFFRAFLAVLSGLLARDLGAGADDLALASGVWFLAFAAMQIPVGWLLDRKGPRRVAGILLLFGGGGGAALFAMAASPAHVIAAMALIGIGCSGVLMASYFIFAREYPPARFATLAALMLGAGLFGNLGASWPMAFAAETLGWRASLWGLAALSGAVAVGILLTVRDPEPVAATGGGSVLTLLAMRPLWPILAVMLVSYAPVAALRGLWIGPYLGDVHGYDTAAIGRASLVMGIAMMLGTLAYGPLDRLLGTRKWVIFTGGIVGSAAVLALAALPAPGAGTAIALLAVAGVFGGAYPVIMAHGRAFVPAHLTGQGVTLLNLFGIGGVGLFQFASAPLHAAFEARGDTASAYAAIFAAFGLAWLAGTLIYLASRDRMT